MYKFALRPWWLVSHLLMIVAVIVMINLAFWQLRRLDERQAFNAQVESRVEQPVAPVTDLIDGLELGETDEIEWRLGEATGQYESADQVLVVNRSLDGRSGAWVLTPLVLDDGTALVVNRGWVPFSVQQSTDQTAIAPPGGEVTVTGLMQSTQTKGSIGAGNPDDPGLLARVDLAAYEGLVEYDIAPAWLQLGTQSPAAGPVPELLPRPENDDGPHLSYAVQWFIFASIFAVGYVLVLRKQVTRQSKDPS